MLDTLTRYLEGISDKRTTHALRGPLQTLFDRFSSQSLTTAGLVISSGGAVTAKIGSSDFYASVTGIMVKIATATAMPVLTGINIPAGNFGIVAFFVSSAGVVTAAGGTPGVTLSAAVFPPFPRGQALVGFLLITYASAFVGNTTPLDTATTVYFNALGAFDPTALI